MRRDHFNWHTHRLPCPARVVRWGHWGTPVLLFGADHEAVKKGLHLIYGAKNLRDARRAAGRWIKRWEGTYPAAVKSLREDLEDLLTCFMFADPSFRKKIRTTNAIERMFREVRRRTRPMGVFENRTSMERILYAVFAHENFKNKSGGPFLLALTQNS